MNNQITESQYIAVAAHILSDEQTRSCLMGAMGINNVPEETDVLFLPANARNSRASISNNEIVKLLAFGFLMREMGELIVELTQGYQNLQARKEIKEKKIEALSIHEEPVA